jgi:hypothetical protein
MLNVNDPTNQAPADRGGRRTCDGVFIPKQKKLIKTKARARTKKTRRRMRSRLELLVFRFNQIATPSNFDGGI